LLKDNKEKISDANRSKIETALNEVKEALKGSDATAIKTAGEKLNETWQVVSAELYKAAAEKAKTGQGHGAGPTGTQPEADASPDSGKEGPIIDAEVVDEKKAA
jgi:molecular chaperone DnaK